MNDLILFLDYKIAVKQNPQGTWDCVAWKVNDLSDFIVRAGLTFRADAIGNVYNAIRGMKHG